MNSTLNIIIVFFIVMPLLLISYQIGTKSLNASSITDYLSQPAINAQLASPLKITKKPKLPERNPNVPELEIDSLVGLAWDFKNDLFFFQKNINDIRPIASLTKLVTVAVVADTVPLEENVAIPLEAIKTEGNQGNLREGEILSVRDLMAAALLESSNDAVYALAWYAGGKMTVNPESQTTPVRAFVRAMNEKFNGLNLVNTNFTDATGLEDSQSFSSARDFSGFIKYLRNNPNYKDIWDILKLKNYKTQSKNTGVSHEFKTTNLFLDELTNVIGGKTGYTNNALGNMVLVLTGPNNTEIIYLVMGSNDRFVDMKKMIDWVNAAWIWPNLGNGK